MFRPPAIVALAVLLSGPPGLTDARADINIFQSDPLIDAAISNDPGGAERLLVRGHSADAADGSGRTALIIAASRGFEDLVDTLVRHRANVDAADKLGNTALFYAASKDHLGIIEILAEAKADIDAKNRQGITPLMGAAAAGRLAAVQKLLELKASTTVTDFTGRTARDWAVANHRRNVIALFDRQAPAR